MPAGDSTPASRSPWLGVGIGCGDGESGAADLAPALLLRATDRASAIAHYQVFKWEVIARLPQADFTLALATGRNWLASRSAT